MYIYTHTHVYIYTYMCVYIHIYIDIYIYLVRVCVCIYIYINFYTCFESVFYVTGISMLVLNSASNFWPLFLIRNTKPKCFWRCVGRARMTINFHLSFRPSFRPSVRPSILLLFHNNSLTSQCIFMQFGMKIMPLYQTMNRVLKFFIAVFSYSRQRPGQAVRAPGDWGSQNF